MSRWRAVGPALGLVAALGACTSPEATRTRAGGPGADTGNHDRVVEMHEGAQPYWRTQRLLSDEVTTPGNPARAERARRPDAPAASPR
jgi:hypothetical protein